MFSLGERVDVTSARIPGRFEGRIALVTGAASGIGRAAARQLAAEGAVVCCADLDLMGVEQSVAAITQIGHSASSHSLDVSVEASGMQLCKTSWRLTSSSMSSLIARHLGCQPVTETASEWRRVLAVI